MLKPRSTMYCRSLSTEEKTPCWIQIFGVKIWDKNKVFCVYEGCIGRQTAVGHLIRTLRLFQQSLLWWYKNQISYTNTLDKINKNKELIETLIKLSLCLKQGKIKRTARLLRWTEMNHNKLIFGWNKTYFHRRFTWYDNRKNNRASTKIENKQT